MAPVRAARVCALLAAASFPALAQDPGNTAAALMPQYATITIGSGSTARTISQTTVPFVFVLPFTPRFNVDLATAYASSDVTVDGKRVSSISGPTDTQLRANLTLGNDAVVLTVGANLPTGQYKIAEGEAIAAGQIGSDFLLFPTSTYGAGLSMTGGAAYARNLGLWNLGVAGSFRKSTEFDAYSAHDSTGRRVLTFTPADEFRARIGADRNVGGGRLTLGVTYSTFGNDVLANTSYATGDRYIGQGSLFYPVGEMELSVSAWRLYRAKGQRFGGEVPAEAVTDGAVALGIHRGGWYIEPNIEVRNWQVSGYKAGVLGSGGVRLRWSAGPFTLLPGVSYQSGRLYALDGSQTSDMNGWRAQVTVRMH